MADVPPHTHSNSNGAGQSDVDGLLKRMSRNDPAFILLLVLAAHPDLNLNYSRMSELSHKLSNPELWITSADIDASISGLVELSQRLQEQLPRIVVHGVDDTNFPSPAEATEISGQYQNGHKETGMHMATTRNQSDPTVQSSSGSYECSDPPAGHFLQVTESKSVTAEAEAAATETIFGAKPVRRHGYNWEYRHASFDDDSSDENNHDETCSIVSFISSRVMFGGASDSARRSRTKDATPLALLYEQSSGYIDWFDSFDPGTSIASLHSISSINNNSNSRQDSNRQDSGVYLSDYDDDDIASIGGGVWMG
ncbi:hypothetical protein VTN96DRAFT_5367 [Rasamsonia emersonii]